MAISDKVFKYIWINIAFGVLQVGIILFVAHLISPNATNSWMIYVMHVGTNIFWAALWQTLLSRSYPRIDKVFVMGVIMAEIGSLIAFLATPLIPGLG